MVITPPGRANLPHTGEVIACYRAKRYTSQQEFAIAAGVDKQTVAYWENQMYLSDPERRIFLAKMLKIPPALLGLTWQQVVYQDHAGTSTDQLDHFAQLVEEDSYYHYEDTLILAWGWYYNGKLLDIADRFGRRLRKLENKVLYVPEHDKEAWKELLCHYRYFAAQIARHRGMDREHKQQALRLSAGAVQLAKDIEDVELTAWFLCNCADIHFEQEHYTQAKALAQASMERVRALHVNTPLYGEIHLRNANVFAPHIANDNKLARQIRGWLDKAMDTLYKKPVEPDKTFLKLNLAAVHHERAKVFLQFHRLHPDSGYLRDARNEMKLAWEAFTPDLAEWKLYFHLTEAQILKAGKDLEGSAKLGLEALKVARDMQSKKRESQIQALYYDLMKIDAKNPYVHHLGAELGIFQ
jgi:DNA-binding XRE family transcriptional regulator